MRPIANWSLTPVMLLRKPLRYRFLWWLIVLVVLAGVPRFLSFDYGLPYVEHVDEPEIYLEALAWRGQFGHIDVMTAYPPGSLVQNMIVQSMLEPLGHAGISVTVYASRLLSVLANLVTLIFIALAARLIAGDIAGIIAGASWAMSPTLLEHGVYALADPIVYMLSAVALWLALEALYKPERGHWCVWSVIVGLVAVLYKYPALPAIVPGGLVAFIIFWRNRRQGLRWLLTQAVLVGVVGFFLIFIYRVDRLDMNVTRQAEDSIVTNLLTLSRTLENVHSIISPIHFGAFVVYGILALAALGYTPRNQSTNRWLAVGVCILSLVFFAWEVSAFTTLSSNGRIRDLLPGTPVACALLGAAVAQVAAILPLKNTLIRLAVTIMPLVLLVYIPQSQANAQLVNERQRPDRRVDIRAWADISLDPGTVIVFPSNHKTFNPFFGGLPGRHWFDWWVTDDIQEFSVAGWIDRGMTYAAIDKGYWETLMSSEAGRAYTETMLYLRDFFDPPRMAGPETVMVRLWRMQQEISATFGGQIHLVGFDADHTVVAPGDKLPLRFYWQADQKPAQDYSLFVHLVDAHTQVLHAQIDGTPARSTRPTYTWDEPSETLISQWFTLDIPADLQPGTYSILIGLYDYETGIRLPIDTVSLSAKDNAIELISINVDSPVS
jgi:hypothetical protein